MSVSVREKIKGSGEWWLFIRQNGKRRSKKIGDKRQAERLAREVRQRQNAGELGIVAQGESFGAICQKWQSGGASMKGRKSSTAGDYASIVKHHLAQSPFWSKPIDTITRAELDGFISSAKSARNNRSPLSASSKNHLKVVISHVYQYAIDTGIQVTNHAKTITISSSTDPDQEIIEDESPVTVYDPDEIERLLMSTKGNFFHPVIYLLARTGLRCSEAAALKWTDIDLDDRVITVRRALVRGKITSPKSKKLRYVDMTHDLVELLRQHRRAQFQDEKQRKNSWVFQNREGKQLDFNNIRKRVYDKAAIAAKLPPSRLHDLRHSFATNLARVTADPVYVYEQLGHHSIDFTMKTYFKSQKSRSSDRKVDQMVAPNGTQVAPGTKKGVSQNG